MSDHSCEFPNNCIECLREIRDNLSETNEQLHKSNKWLRWALKDCQTELSHPFFSSDDLPPGIQLVVARMKKNINKVLEGK